MNRFPLHFAAFVGSASAMALVLVAGISFACQSARVGQGSDKGLKMWNSTASRPQDGLSHPVNTGRPTGGKPVDLRRATREVAAGSPDLEDCSPRVENTPAVSRDGQSGLATVGSFQGDLKNTQVPDDGQRDRPRTGSANAANCVTPRRADGRADEGQQGWVPKSGGGDLIRRDPGRERSSLLKNTVTDRRDGRFAHSSSVSMGESGLSLPGALRSDLSREPWPSEQGVPFFAFDPRTETVQPETEGLLVLASPGSGVHALDRTQGVRSVPGRAVPNEVVLLRDARGHSNLYEVTAYSHGCILPRDGRPEGHARRAANGRWPLADITVAADTSLHPFGTEILIEGLGFRTVGDRGHAIKGRKLDLFVDSCREARRFGRRWLAVYTVPSETTLEGAN